MTVRVTHPNGKRSPCCNVALTRPRNAVIQKASDGKRWQRWRCAKCTRTYRERG